MRVPSGSSPHTRGLLPRVRRGGHGCRIIPAHAGFTGHAHHPPIMYEDHPRTRGVYHLWPRGGFVSGGSSPHTRGLHPLGDPRRLMQRIIPAHAGFTGHAHHPPIMYEDHPRTRGVYHLWPRGGFVSGGSSPHTRGLLDAVPDGVLQGGIIPAHAGFTDGGRGVGCPRPDHPRTRGVYSRSIRSWASRRGSSPHTRGLRRPGPGRRPRSRDHPRTRGVYTSSSSTWAAALGSSPHTRGLHEECPGNPDATGIIPAHAGFTDAVVNWLTNPKDHPRTRGVYETPLGEYIHTSGSSPHTRGLQALVRRISAAQGIIPAHAGFTRSRPRRRGGGRDHPRTRGVYSGAEQPTRQLVGSSPHTRGLPDGRLAQAVGRGIIPAHAGFTSRALRHAARLRDHPRTRGVYPLPAPVHVAPPGSSPHTRGLRDRVTGVTWPLGIIPAHAGFTTGSSRMRLSCTDHPRTRGVYS